MSFFVFVFQGFFIVIFLWSELDVFWERTPVAMETNAPYYFPVIKICCINNASSFVFFFNLSQTLLPIFCFPFVFPFSKCTLMLSSKVDPP